MITYHKPFTDLASDFEVPVLHKIAYPNLPPMQIFVMSYWLKENCEGAYYQSPGYTDNYFVQFEDDEDAVMFALR
jgi:hypothetical protein